MLERGVVDEARAALARPLSRSASKVMGLADFAALPAEEAREALVANNRRLARYQRKWMRRIAGSRRLDGERGRRRRRSRDRGDRASPWNAGAVITRIGERGLATAARRAAAGACRGSRGVHRDVRECVEPSRRAGGASARRRPSGRRRSATKATAGSTGSSAASSPTIRRRCFSSRCGWRPSCAAPALRASSSSRVLQWARERRRPRVSASRSRATIRARRACTRSAASSRRATRRRSRTSANPGSRFYVYEL